MKRVQGKLRAAAVRVFVYGTLRRGESNHFLLAGATFVGRARTLPRYRLLDLGDHPAMQEGGTTAVQGELFDVDASTLQRLDALEEHPDVYQRHPCELEDSASAIAYFLVVPVPAGVRPLPAGDWCTR